MPIKFDVSNIQAISEIIGNNNLHLCLLYIIHNLPCRVIAGIFLTFHITRDFRVDDLINTYTIST